jgi:hypothetical protein
MSNRLQRKLASRSGKVTCVGRPHPLRLSASRPLWCVLLPVLIVGVGCEPLLDPDGEVREDDCFLSAFSEASISLDGQVEDWAGVEPLATDPQGDDSPQFTGDDLRAVYVAQTSQDLFVRVDLWENVNTNFGNGPPDEEFGRYAIRLNNVGSFPSMSVGIAYDSDRGEWSAGHNGASTGVPIGLEGPTFVAVVGSVIEFGVPLSLIDNPAGFTEVRAETLTTTAEEMDQVGQACSSG